MQEKPKKSKLTVKVFHSFEEEAEVDDIRAAEMSPEERLQEFGRLQTMVWGKAWTDTPIKKVVFRRKLGT